MTKRKKKERDRTKKIGDKIYNVEKRYPIPEDCIHIYPEKSIGISISRKFLDLLKELGMEKWKKTATMKYDHPDMSAHVTIIDDNLEISIYREKMPNMRTKLHNFMLVGFDKEFSDKIRKRFPVVARAYISAYKFIGGTRYPNALHMTFNLNEAKTIVPPQQDTRKYFV